MKNLLFFFILFSNLLIGQDNTFKEYSYSQFFRLIEKEQDTVFVLKDAIVKFDLDQDLDFKNAFDYDNDTTRVDEIVISKEIRLNNVHFLRDPSGSTQFRAGVISYVHFKKPIYISSTYGVRFDHCIFEKGLEIRNNENKVFDFSQLSDGWFFRSIAVRNSTINDYLGVILDFPYTKPNQFSFLLFDNVIKMGENKGRGYGPRAYGCHLSFKDIPFVNISNNQFIGKNSARFSTVDIGGIRISNNQFERVFSFFTLKGQQTQNMDFENNQINKPVVLELTGLKSEFDIDYDQFSHGILNNENWRSFVSYINEREKQDSDSLMKYPPEDIFDHYNKEYRIQNLSVFKNEVELRGRLINVYREKHDRKFANAIYIDMKDLETDRLAYEYQEEKNFTTYFTWKVNQFLKVFSAYGTEPARAIVMSMYVILLFALIYLFFPNSWDSHGRNRIIDRYKFFFKYLNRNAGIHEVYLEEKQTEMLTYEEFKKTIAETEKKVPKFFTWSAYPLYKWAISGTQLTAGILRRMDILQGTWTELPEERKWWKGILLTGAFIIALIYDLFIKMLNALMLSINTFTTLGFGEIPIKGLPRYLAIIEGFIGWFMLTIFSVSLISQLLN